MPTVLQFRRGNTTQNNSFTGTAGELSIDTTLDTVRVHDGSTAGGFELTQNAATQTLTNKTINLSSNTLTGTTAQFNTALSDDSFATLAGSETLTNKTLTSAVLNTGVSGTAILDEDNMASDSATQLATQQSIKAYVDSQVTAQDLDFQGDSGGALAVDLDSQTFTIAGGTGIDTSGSGQTLTVAVDSTIATTGKAIAMALVFG